VRLAIVGPTHPYKGGIAQHTTELAHRLAAAGHEVDLVSWSEQYPQLLYPGQRVSPSDPPELPLYPRTSYPLSWRRPDKWWRVAMQLHAGGYDALVLVVVTPVQAPAYLAMLAALRRAEGRAAGRGEDQGEDQGAYRDEADAGVPARRPRVVALCHNVLPHESRFFDKPLTRALLSRVDAVLVHSSAQAALAAEFTRAAVKIASIPPHLPSQVLTHVPADAGARPPAAVDLPADEDPPPADEDETRLVSSPETAAEDDGEKTQVVSLPEAAGDDGDETRLVSLPETAAEDDGEKTQVVSLPETAADDGDETQLIASPPSREDAAETRVTPAPAEPVFPPEEIAARLRRRLLFFGIVRPYKGLDVLLQALAKVPDVSLTVAGEFWGGTEQTEALVRSLGLSRRVRIRPGYVPAEVIPGLFTDVDALVLPYRSGTASQNVWLAHEHGVPVIATRAGTLADAVDDGVDGLLCEPGDPDALAAAIRLFYEPGTPQRLRAGVRPVDPAPAWADYVDVLASAVKAAGAVRS
jgi:glycosyltransferase involved in cell wall biosynthesis